jgi:hypothetical protein
MAIDTVQIPLRERAKIALREEQGERAAEAERLAAETRRRKLELDQKAVDWARSYVGDWFPGQKWQLEHRNTSEPWTWVIVSEPGDNSDHVASRDRIGFCVELPTNSGGVRVRLVTYSGNTNDHWTTQSNYRGVVTSAADVARRLGIG